MFPALALDAAGALAVPNPTGVPALAWPPLIALAVVTPGLIITDLREHRLPNRLVLPAGGIGVATVLARAIAEGAFPLVPLLAGALGFLGLFALAIGGGMGMGDVKLAGALGLAAWHPQVAVLAPFLAFGAGGVVSVVIAARNGRATRIAFGPFLLLGFWVAAGLRLAAGSA